MNETNLVMGEELRVSLPSISGIAAKLRAEFPHLNRKQRVKLAREIQSGRVGSRRGFEKTEVEREYQLAEIVATIRQHLKSEA